MHFILGLLRMLSQVLNNRNASMSIASSALSLSIVSIPLEPENTSKVVLALSTLGNFNFEGLQ